MTDRDGEPTLDVARGDVTLSRQIRDALRVLQDRSGNEQFRSLIDDVLSGRVGLREAGRTQAFAAGVDDGVREFARRWERLSDGERAELADQGRTARETGSDR
jgi:hypothetical protein